MVIASVELHRGGVEADGISEGKFSHQIHESEEYFLSRKIAAFDKVNRALISRRYNFYDAFFLGNIAGFDELEKTVIELRNEFKGSETNIALDQCCHGTILFSREIRIVGFDRENLAGLAERFWKISGVRNNLYGDDRVIAIQLERYTKFI